MTSLSNSATENHCTVLEQRHLVSQMTRCDSTSKTHEQQLECYLQATKESRENKSCMFS